MPCHIETLGRLINSHPPASLLPLRKKALPKGRTVDRGRSGKESGHNIADRLVVVVVVYDTITPIRRDQQKVRVREVERVGGGC
jgi:hypothetical protein